MNAVDVLQYGHRAVLEAIDGLPEPHWDRPDVCGRWSVRDIIAHLASYEHVLVEILSVFLSDAPTPTLNQFMENYNRFNDEQVAQRQHNTAQDVLDEYTRAQRETMKLVTRIPLKTLRQKGALAWYGAEYDLEDFIVYTYYGHKREHCAQIMIFRDHLTRKTGE